MLNFGWAPWKTARRGRKSVLASSAPAPSYASLSSTEKEEKEEETPFGEIEAAEALLMLANGFSLGATAKLQRERDSITKFPEYYLQKKRKIKDCYVGYAEGRLKIARVEKETDNYRDEFALDTVKKTKLEAIHKQTPALHSASDRYRCANCGKPFSSFQALGGHKSSCNLNFQKNEAGESTVQGSKKNTNAGSSAHQCKTCYKSFDSGQALGGHQRKHLLEQVKPRISSSSVSPPENISMDSSYPTNSLTSVEEGAEDNITVSPPENISMDSLYPTNSSTSVQEAAEDYVISKKVMLDLNEPAKEEDDECIDFRCSEQLPQFF
ncbi:hypothetical protein MKW94_006518 [Papaver nudicaule]|uniref:C2H2-type domain-containing protein n=1 Tax=Papaver nudicaule TaxID=74823 RepID=A0AA42AZN1_PAPNU|nr:hypothetical protein [Papaver nudicaule]